MAKIRVLIVDDSVVIRRIIGDVLPEDPEIEVAGTAVNGAIALTKIAQLKPDLVTLDVEMPDMDGLTALAEIRKRDPFLPVIMFSTLTQRGAGATLDALALGANDYVTKPSNVGSMALAMQRIREDLIPKIKMFGNRNRKPVASRAKPTVIAPRYNVNAAAVRSPFAVAKPIEIVAIGVSTGGPNALASLIPTLPADFPVPVVIVQHMPPLFTRLLAERLDSKSELRVYEGAIGDRISRGAAWIAPGDYHMVVQRDSISGSIGLNQATPENSCRPAVDVLFRSVVKAYGSGVLAVVLTGMGQDGLRGCEAVREAGGQIIVQDEASSVVWGMPGYVARAGLADAILPLDELGPEILRRCMERRTRFSTTGMQVRV